MVTQQSVIDKAVMEYTEVLETWYNDCGKRLVIWTLWIRILAMDIFHINLL